MTDKSHTHNPPDPFRASTFSAEGFMGVDSRSVQQIIEADLTAVRSLGHTPESVAGLLTVAFDRAEGAFGDRVELCPGVFAVHYEARGKIQSPFEDGGLFQKGEVIVTERAGGAALNITRLGIHLVRKHGFFQGVGCRYRLDPAETVRLLGSLK